MARGRGQLTKQQRATSGMGSALVCTHSVEHGRRGKAAMKERGAWQSRPSMAVQVVGVPVQGQREFGTFMDKQSGIESDSTSHLVT
ncbi:hypothetical protein TRIUR3_29649 [Triticum urartu]|uniref:Uncharacterized protein n=1 Tax=Triticum urartu TaxID=4572 RepID=M8A0G2_TRIUA|nr:hypothetical protein TRIUR3_29649 [Triticum urartu]